MNTVIFRLAENRVSNQEVEHFLKKNYICIA